MKRTMRRGGNAREAEFRTFLRKIWSPSNCANLRWGSISRFTWVCVYSTYRKSACTNSITSTCHRYITTNVKLCTPTQSLIYRVECDDIYKINRDITRFGTSDYPIDNVYGVHFANKKIPCMKNKNNGIIMIEFVGLRMEMYAVRIKDKKNTIKRWKM